MNKAILIYPNSNYIPTKIMSFLMEQYKIENFIFLSKDIKSKVDDMLFLEVNVYFKYNKEDKEKMDIIVNDIINFLENNVEDNTVVVLEKNLIYINSKIYSYLTNKVDKGEVKNLEIIEDLT